MPKTVKEVCEEKGLVSYDTDLPFKWVMQVRETHSIEPIGNVVWCYEYGDHKSVFGFPIAVSTDGEVLLGKLAMRMEV